MSVQKVLIDLAEYKSLLSSKERFFRQLELLEVHKSELKIEPTTTDKNNEDGEILTAESNKDLPPVSSVQHVFVPEPKLDVVNHYSKEEILKQVQRRYYFKVCSLLDKLSLSSDITWSSCGTVFIEGSELVGSNITRLLRNTFFDSKREVTGERRWKVLLRSLDMIPSPSEQAVNSGAIATDIQKQIPATEWYFLGPA
jgi:hypothetical protein